MWPTALSTWLTVAIAFTAVAAVPSRDYEHRVKESVPSPRGWSKSHPAPADHIISLRIALPQANFAKLEGHLYEVSDPFHHRYGQHLSKAEVEALVAPEDESVHLVNEWLASHGIYEESVTRSPARDWIIVRVPLSQAEDMLKTKYHVWTHDASGDSAVRTTAYSLPEHLHEHIELVQPTTMFSRLKGMRSTIFSKEAASAAVTVDAPPIKVPSASNGQVDASCNNTITVNCILQLYNAVGFTPDPSNGNRLGVTAYLEQWANNQDLQSFFADQRPDAVNSTFETVLINGGVNNQTLSAAGDEADLDTQFSMGISYPTPATFYSTGGRPPFIPDESTPDNTNEPYIEWLDYVLSQKDIPQTITNSWADDEQTVPPSYAQRVCGGFAQLGARGVSVMFASGDFGVGQDCVSNDGRNATRFNPAFPPTCPFVTAVGGTTSIPEVAADFSGGGFSNVFARPSYQDHAIDKFLTTIPATYGGLYNSGGRAIPDVSAQSLNFRIFWRGSPINVLGTSASCPTFSGLVALLNSARISAGLAPLGFLNPLLYTLQRLDPSAFNDITEGNAPGCETEGFNATEGWDAVTGLGTPNFGRLREWVVDKKFPAGIGFKR